MRKFPARYLVPLLVIMAVSLVTAQSYASSKAKNKAASPAASAKSVAHKKIVKISDQIDSLVLAKLKEKGIKQNPIAGDELFVRRIYLDVVGRIPTLEETKSFLDSKSKTKRGDLIDELLDSYGFVSHQFNFLADVLRVKTRSNKVYGQPYIDFIKDSLESNMPYDQFVVELLSAEGNMLGHESRAVGYYLRDLNMPEDNMSNTVRVFLGTRLECAQCHDHPFDKWTQRDYFEMVAFTGGINYGGGNIAKMLTPEEKRKVEKIRDEKSQEGYFRIRRLLSTSKMGVFGSGTGLARLPEGFMGSDGEENEIVVGKTMFEKDPLVDAAVPISSKSKSKRKKKKKKKRGQKNIQGAKEIGSRKAYAMWLTSEENPRFATTIANRLWKQAFGLALIEPVDVIEDNTEASNEELMAYLTDVMIELKFDRKQFLRAIYNSRSYQSVATASDVAEPLTHAFNGPIVRRMSAEQIWDSLLALTVPDTDQRNSASANLRQRELNDLVAAYANKEEGALDNLIEFSDKSSKKNKGSALRKAAKEKGREMRQTMKSLNKKIQKARVSGNVAEMKALMLERAEKAQTLKSDISGKFSRASELMSPAPAGHFLRQFGQSDRDQIENSNREPAVPQILSMMNGMIEKQIVKDPNTVLMTNLLKMQGDSRDANKIGAIDTIFLTMLNREPTRSEKQQWKSDIGSDFRSAYGDLIWTLANSNEFIFLK